MCGREEESSLEDLLSCYCDALVRHRFEILKDITHVVGVKDHLESRHIGL